MLAQVVRSYWTTNREVIKYEKCVETRWFRREAFVPGRLLVNSCYVPGRPPVYFQVSRFCIFGLMSREKKLLEIFQIGRIGSEKK